MMVVGLLLAQLVLPGPPSGPIQPPGMICLGECAGPVVWGPAERGRLVVACDMRSDTCSDGRRIMTTRSTPVPCETSPGVWEIVPADRGCYSVRGLEAWAATTSYLAYGAELDRSPWLSAGQATLEKLDGFYRLSGPVGSNVVQTVGNATEQTTYTFACILRGTGQARMQFSGPQVMSLSPEWRQYSRTASIPAGGVIAPRIYTGDGSSTSDPVDIMGCWLTRTSTPGRPCWGGEAPVTCGADSHTISTEGWPVVAGEVSFIYTPGAIDDETKYLVSASTFQSVGWEVYVRLGSPLAFLSHAGGSARIIESDPLTWEARPYHIRVRWRAGEVVFWRDGVEVGRTSLGLVPAGPLPSTARIGLRASGASGWINGSISNLRIRSTE